MPLSFDLTQRLETSGARAIEPFEIDGAQYLAVAQMSKDIPGQKAGLNGGDSNTSMPIFRWDQGAQGASFTVVQKLDVPGGEDAEFFRIGDRIFLATASIRTGAGPYQLNTDSAIFEWRDGRFVPFQSLPTFAAKQWRHFSIEGRHFLALAQGVVMDGAVANNPSKSCIFEWNGANFVHLHDVASGWGYNWRHVDIGGRHFLAYADHAVPSRLLAWNGNTFDDFQPLGGDKGSSGRAFSFFESRGEQWLAFANLLHESVLLRWTGKQFEPFQVLCGPGARELLWLDNVNRSESNPGTLVQANFILGSRDSPQPMAQSCAYQWQGDKLVQTASFESSGAVDVAAFQQNGSTYLAVANSLSGDLRFRTDSLVYQLAKAAP